MTDEADLIAAVLRSPEEDTPRLMYADYLQEHGQEARAEFIRSQIAGTPRKLRKSEAANWFPLFPNDFEVRNNKTGSYLWYHGGEHNSASVRRGFISSVTCTAADWLRHAGTITATHPVERVTLTSLPDMQWAVDSWDIVRRANLEPKGSLMGDAFRARWPGIEFVIPPAVIMNALAQVG